jgi:hypothetical protein
VTIPDAVKIQFLPSEDEHSVARNMSRDLMYYIYYRIKELCIKLVIKTSLYYDVRSEKHQIMQNEEFHDLHTSPNTTRMIQSRRKRRTDHVTSTVEKRKAYRVLMWQPVRRDDVDVIGIDGILILEIFKEQNGVVWTGLDWTELVGGSCEHGNESVDSTNAGKLSSS